MKNNLKNTLHYLSGPIDRDPTLGVAWRDDISSFIRSLGAYPLNPLHKPVYGFDEDADIIHYRQELLKQKKYNEIRNIMKSVRAVDLRLVDKSDALIVNIDMKIPMMGTIEEIVLGNRQKKPCLVHIEGGLENSPHWLWGMLPVEYIFGDWDSLKDYLTGIDNGTVESDKRWVFLDFDKIIYGK